MLNQDGVTVVFLFSFQKYLQYFHIGCKFPHYSADCTTGVWMGHQEKTKDFVTWHGQAVTKHPWWLAASSQPLFFCWQSLLPKTTVGPLSLKMLKTQLDMTWTTSRNVILALLWGGSWTAWLLEVPCNLNHPQFLCLQNTGPFWSATYSGRRNAIPKSYWEVYKPKTFLFTRIWGGKKETSKGDGTCTGLGNHGLVYLLKLIPSTSKELPWINSRCLVLEKRGSIINTVMQASCFKWSIFPPLF